MNTKILLTLVASVCMAGATAQKKQKQTTAYAITGSEKGNSRWTEVKLVDINTGEEIQSVYNSSDETSLLNARTGKAITKKENELSKSGKQEIITIDGNNVIISNGDMKDKIRSITKKEGDLTKSGKHEIVTLDGDKVIITKMEGDRVTFRKSDNSTTELIPSKRLTKSEGATRVVRVFTRIRSNAPFSTYSAACAYDKKHDRLYYTPMGVNELRYIDLKSKTQKIFYFENEPLGVVQGPGDVGNQITRMVIGGDGNGYALTNNGDHLIRFSTKKKAKITDLGALTDDGSNGNNSIHSRGGYGGDMVADNSGNLYLITAHRAVFKINIDTRVATYKGTIKGLPKGFSTNGAVVESGTNIIVTSSTSTSGYYMFDLNTMQAAKVSQSSAVYNASDMANGNLISDKKVKEDKPVEAAEEVEEELSKTENPSEMISETKANKLSVYPNPATNGQVNLSFNNYESGRYDLQLLDLNGKVIQSQNVRINSKVQTQEIRLPSLLAKGNYIIKVIAENGKVVNVEKLIVQ
jgi:hypothetical protein